MLPYYAISSRNRDQNKPETKVLWIGAYNVSLWRYGASRTKRHIEEPVSIANVIKMEFEELRVRWKAILDGSRAAFVHTHIDTSWMDAPDTSECEWADGEEQACAGIYALLQGKQALKGINMKRSDQEA